MLRFVPITPDGLLDLENFDSLLDGPVKIFSFTHISNTLGTINPVSELCSRARRAGVVTLVDAAQSAGHRPVDVREMGCDFLALSGHKMCGPTGAGVLYGRKEILQSMEPFHGGGEMIVSVGLTESEFKPPPQRFEAGTPAIAQAIGLGVAANYLDEIGRQRIFEHDQALALQACALIEEVPGVRIFGPRDARAGLVSFVLESVHAHDVVSMADQYGLALRGGHHCTQPLHQLRGDRSKFVVRLQRTRRRRPAGGQGSRCALRA
jgi:cysteine desulfurase/selenocysteine lyase